MGIVVKPEIILNREAKGWMAYYGADWLGDRIHDLFGTRILPTGFTAAARSWDVLKTIRELNPDINVNIRQENRNG